MQLKASTYPSIPHHTILESVIGLILEIFVLWFSWLNPRLDT